jgi:hypothetical protein
MKLALLATKLLNTSLVSPGAERAAFLEVPLEELSPSSPDSPSHRRQSVRALVCSIRSHR